MFRQLFTTFLLLACLATAPINEAAAQGGSGRALVPDDLSQLPMRERIRMIESEYRLQSGQRQIPDDQLDFYLDQIQSSRWTFSRIKADIATSLRGNSLPGSGWQAPSSGWAQSTVICSSRDRQYTECRTPFRGRARIVQQMSDTRCIENNNWGQRSGLLWVSKGCRARFGEDPAGDWGNDGNWGNGQRITCESREGRYRECRTHFRGTARLTRKLSNKSCDAGRDWGSQPGLIWVNNGCRAEFEESSRSGGQNSGYSVSCFSENGRYRACAWDRRQGTPRLIDQESSSVCVEGRNWGYDQSRGLWVDKNCRGRFGPR